MGDNRKIYHWFRQVENSERPSQTNPSTIACSQADGDAQQLLSIDEAIERLNGTILVTPNTIAERRSGDITKWNFIRLLSVRRYLNCLKMEQPKQKSSEDIAALLFPGRNVYYFGKQIRKWAQHYMQYGNLPDHSQGKFVKTRSLIHDEDVQNILRTFIRSEPQVGLTSARLASWINENVHLKLGLENPLTISSRAAQRWMNILGLRFGKFAK